MAGYSGTPLAKELGIKERHKVDVVGAPTNYRTLLEPLPPSVQFASQIDASTDVVHVFATARASLARTLATVRRGIEPRTTVWILWPKMAAKVAADVTEDTSGRADRRAGDRFARSIFATST
jgi:hypothetical protein